MKIIKRYPLKFTAFLFFVIFCALSSFVYLTLGSGSVKSLIEQMLHREQIIARSGVRSIASFIDLSSKSILILADNPNLNSDNIKFFIESWTDTPLSGIIQVDKRGEIITAFSNIETLKAGGNVFDRDYFQSALKLTSPKVIIGKPVISRATGANQSYKIPLAVPLFKNNQFDGIISVSVTITLLTQNYLEPLKISNQTEIFLINSEGIILSSLHSEVIGDSIQNYVANHPFLGDKIVSSQIQKKINLGGEHKLDIAIPNLSTGKITRTLIAIAPITIRDNSQWYLAITTPAEDALIFISPFIMRNLLGIIISFFVSIAITLFLFNRFVKN